MAEAASKIEEEPEIAVEQVRQEAVLEVKFAQLKRKYGIEDRRTLDTFFKLFDLWIMLYRLNKADAALNEVVPACEWRRDDYAIKAIQAWAFTRWKQGRFREALEKFHEMEGWMGKNPALSENIGHTYNSIGAHSQSERYFKEALTLTHALSLGKNGNEGGILLGLAGLQEKDNKLDEALPTALKAYEIYKAKDVDRGWETSLTAKAAMQVSKVLVKLDRLLEAQKYTEEAIRLFTTTAGDDTPLLSGAFERLAEIHVKLGRSDEAHKAYHKAYQLEAIKDAFDLVAILQIHNALVDAHVKSTRSTGLDRTAFRRYFGVLNKVVRRVKAELPQDGNAGAYYKSAGEVYVLGDDCGVGLPLLKEAVRLFKDETSVDTSGLIKQSLALISYCKKGSAEL